MTSSHEPKPESEVNAPPTSQDDNPQPTAPDDVAGEWRQASPVFILIGALRNVRGIIVPLLFVVVTQGMSGSASDLIWYGIAVLGVVVSVVASVLQWWVYRYRVGDREITLRTGIIARQERVIPFERIQSVDVQDAPLERMFQVEKVRIDTGAGGGNDAEIELQAMSRADAEALRTHLLAARQRLRSGEPMSTSTTVDEIAPPVVIDEGVVIRKLSTGELLIAGATSGRVGAAAAIAGVLVQFGEQLMPQRLWERVPWDGLLDLGQQVEVLATLLISLAILAWLISIIATVLTYGGFEIRRQGDQLQVQYGLLDRRRTTIPLRRIQAVRIDEAMLRQPFRRAEVRFDSAGFGADAGASGVLFPLLPRADVAAFLEAAVPEFAQDWQPTTIRKLPARARRRYIVAATIGWLLLVLIAAVVIWRWIDVPAVILIPAVLATPFFALLGNMRYRDAGWLAADGRLLMRWRALSRVTVLTQVRRLQYRGFRADPFQRRADLVTVRTAVASGGSQEGFSLPHLDAREAEQLMEELGGPLGWRSQPARSPRIAPPVDVGF